MSFDMFPLLASKPYLISNPKSGEEAEAFEFAFVNLSDPAQAGDQTKRKFVRQFVRRSQQSSNVSKSKIERRLQVSPLVYLEAERAVSVSRCNSSRESRQRRKIGKTKNETSMGLAFDFHHRDQVIPFITSQEDEDTTFTTVLGLSTSAWRKSLSINQQVKWGATSYPIQMNRDAYRVVEFCHHDFRVSNVSSLIKSLWFKLQITDEAAFLELLCGVSRHIGLITGCDNEHKAVAFQSNALRSVHKRLGHPVDSVSLGIIISVVSFMLQDSIAWSYNPKRYRINRDGLIRIIENRGGIETINCPETRLLILWVDVNAAYVLDIEPVFPIPAHILPALPTEIPILQSPRFTAVIEKWKDVHPSRKDFQSFFGDLFTLNSIVRLGLPEIATDPCFQPLHILPLMRRFLGLITDCKHIKNAGHVEKACTLAAFLYLGDYRSVFGEHYRPAHYRLVERLKCAVLAKSNEWDDFPDLTLWALVQGAINAVGADRPQFIARIRSTMEVLAIKTWTEATHVLNDLIWIEDIYGPRCQQLGIDVMV